MKRPATTLTLVDYDLAVLELALRGYLEGLEGDYEDEHVHMERLRERLRVARRRLQRRADFEARLSEMGSWDRKPW